jgi:hypothetical protein
MIDSIFHPKIPNHKEIAKNILSTIIRNAGLTCEEFLNLCEGIDEQSM